jgi:YVTN family beta-propeller protein
MRQLIVPVLLLAALASGQWLETVIELPPGSYPSALCYGPIDNKVYCSSWPGWSLFVIDGATNQVIRQLPNAGGGPLLYNPARNVIYSAMYWDSAIVVVDGASNSIIARPEIGGTPKAMCYMSSGYSPVVACACDLAGKVVIMEAQTHVVIAALDVGSGPQSMCYDPSMDRLFCANRWDSTVTTTRGEVDPDIWFVEAWLQVGRYPDGLCYDSTDAKAYCGTEDRGVAVITRSLEVTHVPTGRHSVPACYNPRQNMVYCTDRDTLDTTVTVIDCSTDVVVATVAVGYQPKLAYYNAMNNKVYCVNYKSCDVSVIDAATNEVVVTIPVDSYPAAIAWNPAQNRTYVSCASSPTHVGSIYVLRDSMPAGVEEVVNSEVRMEKVEASVVRSLPAGAVAFDAMGRRVLNPKSGIYFVRAVGGKPSAVSRHKVVIQR